jgi:hypothetical protein
MRSFYKLMLGFVAVTVLSGCGLDLQVPKIEIPPGSVKIVVDDADLQKQLDQLGGNQLVCSAGLPASAGGVVSADVATPINVNASGGVGPYRILNTAVSFTSATVVTRTYSNNGSSNLMVVDTVSVVDSMGLVTQCNFVVTVLPKNNPSTLACTLNSSPSTVEMNAPVSFIATASGGSGGYNFSNLTLGSGGSVLSSLSPINSTQASASASFASAGMKTNSVRVTDSSNNFVVCSSSVTVQGAATVSLVATPSASVAVGSAITVTAVTSNFSTTPNYVFTTTQSGISLIPSGNSITVTSSNGLPHTNFPVQVTASSGSQSATATIQLTFTGASGTPLNCTLTHPAGTFRVNNDVPFSITATNGEPLIITTFVVTSDGNVVQTSNSTRTVRYNNPGIKYVYALAKGANSGEWCNQGNYLVDNLEILNSTGGGGSTLPLACVAYTNYNPSYLNEYFYAYGVLTGGNPSNRWVDSVRVLRNGALVSNYTGYWYDRYTAVLAITNSTSFNPRTTYQVELTAKDNEGRSAICSTNHIVQ